MPCWVILKSPKARRVVQIKAVNEFARKAKAKYGYWGSNGLWIMQHWGAIGREIDLDGM
jgi:hypothetical protein